MAAEEVRVDGKESSTGIPHSKRYPVGEGLICHGSDHTINSAKGQKSERCSSVSDSRSLIATQHFDGKLRYKGQETRESPLVGKTMVFSAGKKKFDSGISQIGESFLGLASGSTHKHRCFSPPESEEAYSVSHQERTTEEPYRGPVQFAFVASDCEEVGWRVRVKQRWPDGL